MLDEELRSEQFETRIEGPLAILAVIALQAALALVSAAQGWELDGLGWWIWLVALPFELALLALLAARRRRGRVEEIGRRRSGTLAFLALVTSANAFLLVAVLASLVRGHEESGAQLLLKGLTVWTTNVVASGLWFWALDRGGPVRRLEPDPPPPDFQFPQTGDGGWRPRLFDYLYVAFTNSLAFSPTDAMPLTRRAKAAMLVESAISAVTLLFIGARAVNILR